MGFMPVLSLVCTQTRNYDQRTWELIIMFQLTLKLEHTNSIPINTAHAAQMNRDATKPWEYVY